MSPTLVFDMQRGGRIAFALGGSGGPTIVSSVIQVLVDVLDLQLDPQVAVNLPRVHVQVSISFCKIVTVLKRLDKIKSGWKMDYHHYYRGELYLEGIY